MTSERAVAFLAFAVVAAGTPGPSNVLLVATAANVGVRRGLPALFGVVLGMGVLMFAVTFGLGSAVVATPIVSRGLSWAGAAFLLWLAFRIAVAGEDETASSKTAVGFVEAAAFQWVNPKSWLACASAAGTYLDPGSGRVPAQAMALAALFMLAALPCCFAWLAFGATMQRWLRTGRARRAFNIAMALLLAASVVAILR